MKPLSSPRPSVLSPSPFLRGGKCVCVCVPPPSPSPPSSSRARGGRRLRARSRFTLARAVGLAPRRELLRPGPARHRTTTTTSQQGRMKGGGGEEKRGVVPFKGDKDPCREKCPYSRAEAEARLFLMCRIQLVLRRVNDATLGNLLVTK